MKRISTTAATIAAVATLWPAGSASAYQSKNPHKRMDRACETCHVSSSFHEITFDHDDTNFLLEGSHREVACLQCHNIEDFSKVDRNCVSCHEDVHLERLGTDCSRCHTPLEWSAVKGDDIHAQTDFPLMGRHILLSCESCHLGQAPTEFSQTPGRCFDCHRTDYVNASNPSHVGSGFSTLCTDCHQLTGWKPAMMPDHDPIFPIFSGTHRGQWDDCVICHDQPGNTTAFTCLSCHRHNRTDTDGAHQGIGGYVYASQACYSCHPTGEAGSFINHDSQFFPIYSGAHQGRWADCATCHPDLANRSVFTCFSCHAHDQAQMDDKHQGKVQGYSYTSAACYQCHPNGRH